MLQVSCADPARSVCDNEVKINDAAALSQFVATETWHDVRKLVEEFGARIERGEVVGTINRDGLLVAYLWLNPNQESAYLPLVRQHYRFPPGSSALYNGYTHPAYRGNGYYQRIVNRLVSWNFTRNPQGALYAAVEPANKASLHVLMKSGFRPVSVLGFKCCLGRRTTYQKASRAGLKRRTHMGDR